MDKLTYEDLDVYKCAIEFLAKSSLMVESLPKGQSALVDQLKRASLSICLNIAEGSGKPSQTDGKRFYGIARGSAMECGAIYDACNVLGLIEAGVYDEGKKLIVRIVSMLFKMG